MSWKELAFFDGFCLGNFLPKSGSTDLGGVELAFVSLHVVKIKIFENLKAVAQHLCSVY